MSIYLCASCLEAYGLEERDLRRLERETASCSGKESNQTATVSDSAETLPEDSKPSGSLGAEASRDNTSSACTRSTAVLLQNVEISGHNGTRTAENSADSVKEDSSLGHRCTLESTSTEPSTPSTPPIKRLKLDLCPPRSLCVGCLGILDDTFIAELARYIAERLGDAGYVDLETFRLSITTPLSLLIRRKGVELYLQDSLEGAVTLMPYETYVKETLRAKLRDRLIQELSPLQDDTDSPFEIIVKVNQDDSASECNHFVREVCRETTPNPRGRRNPAEVKVNTVPLKNALGEATPLDFKEHNHFLSPLTSQCSYEVDFHHKPLHLAGRYNKYSRTLPQTPWIVEGVKKADSSVQELICSKVQELVPVTEFKFSSSGREDVDVRMLGNGRPFLLELCNPKKVVLSETELTRLQESINGSTEAVAVRNLKVVPKEAAGVLKEGEEEKRKLYSALIWTSQEITPGDLKFLSETRDLKIHQRTPIRVLHRRSLATRERIIYSLQGEFIDGHHFRLLLSTQAGTYIKEFVHGDFGRTEPHLGGLMGQEVDILALDVQEVALEWPPPAQ